MACIMKSTIIKSPSLPIAKNFLFSPNFAFSSSSLSIPSKAIKPHQFSCSFSSPFSFSLLNNPKKPLFSSLIASVAEENTALLEKEEQVGDFNWGDRENYDFDGTVEAQVDDWEGDGDTGAAVGDAEEEEEEYVRPPQEEAKVYVGNLPFDIDSERLAHIFEQAGVVEIAQVIYNRETDQSRGFGFVTMSTVEEAEKAVEMFHQYNVNGRQLIVNKAAPKGSRPERQPHSFDANRIYVGNLPWDVDEARLEQVFSEHGKVLNVRVVFDKETNRSRGFGFVTMSNESELNDAIANLDGQSLNGRTIRVNVAEERRPRQY